MLLIAVTIDNAAGERNYHHAYAYGGGRDVELVIGVPVTKLINDPYIMLFFLKHSKHNCNQKVHENISS